MTKTTSSNGTMTHHGRIMNPREKRIHVQMIPPKTPFHEQILHTSSKKFATEADAGQTAIQVTQWYFLILEPSARLYLNFKRSQHNSKQSLKQLHLYLHVNHVQSYSDKAPDTYFFKRRDVGRGAGRSTVIAGFSNGSPCVRFGRRDVHPGICLEP